MISRNLAVCDTCDSNNNNNNNNDGKNVNIRMSSIFIRYMSPSVGKVTAPSVNLGELLLPSLRCSSYW